MMPSSKRWGPSVDPTARSICVVLKDLAPSELLWVLSQAPIPPGYDFFVSAINVLAPPAIEIGAVLAVADLWAFQGTVVTTCPETASAVRGMPVTTVHYAWGPDWTRVSQAPNPRYWCRSKAHAAASKLVWGMGCEGITLYPDFVKWCNRGPA